jgi:hypothetical protein
MLVIPPGFSTDLERLPNLALECRPSSEKPFPPLGIGVSYMLSMSQAFYIRSIAKKGNGYIL